VEFRRALSAFNFGNSPPHSVDILVDDLGARDHSVGHLECSRCVIASFGRKMAVPLWASEAIRTARGAIRRGVSAPIGATFR
jgi:hypothetical protein